MSAIIFIILSWTAFYLVDLRNFLGLRDLLFNLKSDYFFFTYRPFFFQHWGRNSGLAEIIQWAFLSSSALLAIFIAGKNFSGNKKITSFLVIIAISFLLMLMEDAGNLRHTLMSYVQAIFDEPDQGIFGTGFKFLYFAILGGLPLYALIRYYNDVKKLGTFKSYLIIGFAFYALAASLSFWGSAFEGIFDKNFYEILGEGIYSLCLTLGDAQLSDIWYNWNQGNHSFQIGFFIMDSMVEETLELLGGSFLLAGFSYLLIRKNK